MKINQASSAFDYARMVSDGDIVACDYIKKACEKFLRDIDNHNAKFYFDQDKAQHILDFYTLVVKHVKGDLAGKVFKLEPWQIFTLVNLYGFYLKSNRDERRFKNAIMFVARKNGKTAISAGLPIYEMLFGGEGLEIYSAATMREQAKLVWESTQQMIRKAPQEIKQKFVLNKFETSLPDSFGYYKTLGRDSKSLDGLRPVLCIFDEFAQVKDRNLWEVIQSGQGSITNYLNLMITTASDTKETTFYENLEYAKGVLDGKIDDDEWFAQLYSMDDHDEWSDPEVWIKANPNIGVSLTEKYLQSQINQAKEITHKRNNILIKHLNVFASSSEAWLAEEEWTKNAIPEIDRSGPLWVGVDLGATSDLTALTFLFRSSSGSDYHVETKCFIPESALDKLPKVLKTTYADAIDSGTLMVTEGNATDYTVVKEYLQNYVKDKDLQEIAFDPWKAVHLSTELYAEGAPMVEVRQLMSNLAPATSETTHHILEGKIKHNGDPFLTWQLNNCTTYTDSNDNVKVRKGDDNSLKIDSIVSMIMAVNRASINGGLKKRTFHVYS